MFQLETGQYWKTVVCCFARSAAQVGSDGDAPLAGLMQATIGTLYRVTIAGGAGNCFGMINCGTIFSLDMGLSPFVQALTYSGKVGK